MSIKKINGYKIMMDLPLGHGAYGTVILFSYRSIKENKIKLS